MGHGNAAAFGILIRDGEVARMVNLTQSEVGQRSRLDHPPTRWLERQPQSPLAGPSGGTSPWLPDWSTVRLRGGSSSDGRGEPYAALRTVEYLVDHGQHRP